MDKLKKYWWNVFMCGLFLLPAAGFAQEKPQALAPDDKRNYSMVVNQVLDWLQSEVGRPVLRFELAALALEEMNQRLKVSDLDEQIKREPPASGGGSRGGVAVIYPDLVEPYRGIFAKIIEGIEGNSRIQVRSYAVGPKLEAVELNKLLKRDGVKVVIALGRQGIKAAFTLDRDIAVVVGGVLGASEIDNRNLSGVHLTPDPSLLFVRLKSLLPNHKRVIVIYDPQNNEWLIKLAREAARAQGLELATHEARDLAAAARLYESILAGADSRRDAVWLPQDATTVDESTILPLVLKESWNRNIPVFSSSLLHVKKGALFALYPNNVELGRTLASSAEGVLGGEARGRGVSPLREVLVAVNLRTASHIGLNLDTQQLRFDVVFPEP